MNDEPDDSGRGVKAAAAAGAEFLRFGWELRCCGVWDAEPSRSPTLYLSRVCECPSCCESTVAAAAAGPLLFLLLPPLAPQANIKCGLKIDSKTGERTVEMGEDGKGSRKRGWSFKAPLSECTRYLDAAAAAASATGGCINEFKDGGRERGESEAGERKREGESGDGEKVSKSPRSVCNGGG